MSGFNSRNTEALWAIRDLEDFSSTPWNEDAVLMPAEVITKVREASSVLSRVVLDGVFIDEVDRTAEIEALHELSCDDRDRIALLEETIKKLRTQVRELKRDKLRMGKAIEETEEQLSEVVVYGGEQAFKKVIDDLNEALSESRYDEDQLNRDIEDPDPEGEEV